MPSTANAVCVDPKEIDRIWPLVSHFFEIAYSYPSDETFEIAERKILTGTALLWLAWDGERILAAAATELWNKPTGKICAVIAAAGVNLKKWKHCLQDIEDYARREDCVAMRLEGRSGWQRIFRDYSQPWIVLEKRF